MNKKKKYIITALIILLVGVVFYNKVYLSKSTYEKIKPTVGDLEIQTFGIGNVGAKEIYNITSYTASKIKALYTDVGKWVKKGDLLVEMDAVDLPLLLKEAKISAKKAEFELNATKKELDSLQAKKELALKTYKRYKKLKDKSFASQAEFDKAKSDLDSIIAQIEATKAHISSANEEVKRADTNVKAIEVKLSKYKIYAPVDGYIISKNAEVAQSVVPTQSIFKIVNPKDVWIKAYIDERISSDIKVGQSATITLRSQKEKKFEGIVKRVVPQSDAITEEREVDVGFKNLPIPFFINEQAEVLINSKRLKNAIQIPTKALVYKDGQSGVWIKKDSKAHFLKVKILGISGKKVAVKNLDKDVVILIPSKKKKPLFEGSRVY